MTQGPGEGHRVCYRWPRRAVAAALRASATTHSPAGIAERSREAWLSVAGDFGSRVAKAPFMPAQALDDDDSGSLRRELAAVEARCLTGPTGVAVRIDERLRLETAQRVG